MSSVTGRINSFKQPRGGFIKPSQFEVVVLKDSTVLNEEENISASIVGTAVDYLTRLVIGTNKDKAFEISLQGAVRAEEFGEENAYNIALDLLNDINGIDEDSVINACKLVRFDVWRRNPMAAIMARNSPETYPDQTTINNIQVLVKRSMSFFDKYGPITKDGFTFEPINQNAKSYEKMIKNGKGTYGGYTATVNSGDGDFLTADTLWDFKVSKSKPTNKHTLQLLMYWIMGQHSGQEIYKSITKLGIFNPRLNTVYLLDMKNISDEIIQTVEKEVICYE